MHQLIPSDLLHFIPNYLLSIRPFITENKILATVYITFIVHGTYKKISISTRSLPKKIYSRFQL